MTLQVGHSTSQRQRTQSWTVSVWTRHKASQLNSWTTRPSFEPFMASKAEQLSTCGPMWQPSPSWPSLSAGASAHNHFAAWLASSVHLSIVFWYSKKTTHTVLFNQRLALLNCSGILWRPPSPFWATLLARFDHTAFARFSPWGMWAVQKYKKQIFCGRYQELCASKP